MSTERPGCGLSSLLPTSCRGRAEAFARRLQSRLQTLGRPSDNEDSNVADENSWLAPKTVATTQPRLSSSSDSDLYFDFDVEPTSPASPVDEPAELLVNQRHHMRDPESGFVLSSSSPSPGSESSDGLYFDLENPDHESKQSSSATLSHRNCNGHVRVSDDNSLSSAVNKENIVNELLNSSPSEQPNTCIADPDVESAVNKENIVNELLNSSPSDQPNTCIADPEVESAVNKANLLNELLNSSPSDQPNTCIANPEVESAVNKANLLNELLNSSPSEQPNPCIANPEVESAVNKANLLNELLNSSPSEQPNPCIANPEVESAVNKANLLNELLNSSPSEQSNPCIANPEVESAVNKENLVNELLNSSPSEQPNPCIANPEVESAVNKANLLNELLNSSPSEQPNPCIANPEVQSAVNKENLVNELLNSSPSEQPNTCIADPEVESRMSSSQVQEKPDELCNLTDSVLAENGVPSGSYCSTFCRPSNLCIQCPVQYNGNQEVCDLLSITTCASTSEKTADEQDSSPENRSCSKSLHDSASVNIKELLKKGFSEEEVEEELSEVSDDLKETEAVTESVASSQILDLSSLSVEETSDTGNLVAPDVHAEHVPEDERNKSENDPADEVFFKIEENSSSRCRSNDTDEDEDSGPQRLRRCTSLKSGKTPPGTPGRKKIVRFADVLGLDLADVRTFLDEVPRIPSSAYDDLRDADLSLGSCAMPVVGSVNTRPVTVEPNKCLVPLFQQPGGQPDFMERVRERQVCLENAVVKDPVMFRIEGTVRVRNLDFHKSVHIRYTLDGWSTFADLQATYISNSCDGFSDKFCFVLYAHTLVIGQRLEFAVRFQCKGCQFWDSNQGANYAFQCLPPTSSTPHLPLGLSSPEDRWAAFY